MSDEDGDQRAKLELTLEEEIFGGDDSDISDLEDAGHIAFQEEEEVADVEPVAKGKGKLSRAPAAYAYREDDDDEEEDEEGAARPKSRDRDQEYRPSADAKAEQFVLVKKARKKRTSLAGGDDDTATRRKAKRTPRARIERRSSRDATVEEGDGAPEKSETMRNFDAVVDSFKSGRRRAKDYDEASVDEVIAKMITKMKQAVHADLDSNANRQPATAKLKLLPRVLLLLQKTYLHEQILEHEMLDVLRQWLEPMPDASLPAINIRRSVLEVLAKMPIATDQLHESRLGRVIMFMNVCPRELPELRKKAGQLINVWCRPLLNRNANERQQFQNDIVSPIDDPDVAPGGQPRVGDLRYNAKVIRPQAVRTAFIHHPPSNVPASYADERGHDKEQFASIRRSINKSRLKNAANKVPRV